MLTVTSYHDIYKFDHINKNVNISSSNSRSLGHNGFTAAQSLQYTGLMHFMITRFSLHHFLEVS